MEMQRQKICLEGNGGLHVPSFFFFLSLCRVPLAQLHLDCFESKQRWNNTLIEGEELSFRQKPKGQTRARAQV